MSCECALSQENQGSSQGSGCNNGVPTLQMLYS